MSILKEMKRDLVDPIKTFTKEVCSDTVGDAMRFYSAQAKTVQQSAKLAEQRAKEKAAAVRREQEEMKKNREVMIKRAVIIISSLAVLGLVIITVILKVFNT